MRIGKNGIDLIKSFEGCRLTAYLCPANVWTIGYGTTSGVKKGMVITKAKAEELLKQDLIKFEKIVTSTIKEYINQNQFDALVSFSYNIGNCNSIGKLINAKNYSAAGFKFLEFNKARVNGVKKELAGLTRRREAERKLFLTPCKIGVVKVKKTSNPYKKPLSVIKLGSRGNDVKWLQFALNQNGYKLTVDGIFGSGTFQAVKRYQSVSGLVIDGIVGIKTIKALE